MSVTDLPAVNATLNSICTLLLLAGWWFIKHERKRQHIICMASALTVSAVFLTSYVIYHYHVGSVRFTYEHTFIRPLYFFILITHVILAAAIVPMVVMTVIPALRARYDRHQKVGADHPAALALRLGDRGDRLPDALRLVPVGDAGRVARILRPFVAAVRSYQGPVALGLCPSAPG